jgi:hypothetical protein
LALPEWRAGAANGSLADNQGRLTLAQAGDGENLLAGLFIDVDPTRIRKPLTWRQLTVAADREIVAADVAVGYRVRIGQQQWLIYRSLAAPDIRTVLGKNLMHELFVGRFLRQGGTETLLEIEA